MPKDSNEEPKLSRWEMRKLAVAAEQEADIATAVEDNKSTEELQLEKDEQEAMLTANREAAEAVNLDELNEKSDFSVFLKEGVPEFLKKKAMLTLWRSNPIFANVDGLVDYDDDFANPDLIMKTFESAYQTGRGYVDHIKNEARKAGLIADELAEEEAETAKEEEEIEELEAVLIEADEEQTLKTDATIPYQEEVVEVFEEEQIEQAAPKVSLRRRFELESKV